MPRASVVVTLVASGAFASPPAAITLWYQQVPSSETLIGRVRVLETAPNTYYCVFGWNPGAGGGYTGLQTGTVNNLIFSLWDLPTGASPQLIYAAPSSQVYRFTNEGSGLHWDNSRHGDCWRTGQWYTLATRSWNSGPSSYFGLWTLDETTKEWTNHVVMSYPVSGERFNHDLYSFLEMWRGYDPAARRVEFRDLWCRSEGVWKRIQRAESDGGYTVNPGSSGVSPNAFTDAIAFVLESGPGHDSNTTVSLFVPSAVPPSRPVPAIDSMWWTRDPLSGSPGVAWRMDRRTEPVFAAMLNTTAAGEAESSGSFIVNPRATFSPLSVPAGSTAELTILGILGASSRPCTISRPVELPRPVKLTTLAWRSASNGYGPVEIDQTNGGAGAGDGAPLSVSGVPFDHGIGCHAPSSIVYDLPQDSVEFVALLGVPEEHTAGSVVFQVVLDGRTIFETPIVTSFASPIEARVNVTGCRQLELRVLDGGDGNTADHANWCEPTILLSSQQSADALSLSGPVGCPSGPIQLSCNANDVVWQIKLVDDFGWRAIANGDLVLRGRLLCRAYGADTGTLRLESATGGYDWSERIRVLRPGTFDAGPHASASIKPRPYGDADRNNTVDFRDITAVLANFGDYSSDRDMLGDANADLSVNFLDITTVLAGWSQGCPG